MADVSVKTPTYEEACHAVRTTPPTDRNFQNMMRVKAERFHAEIIAPKRAARKKAVAEARPAWLATQPPEVQESMREYGRVGMPPKAK